MSIRSHRRASRDTQAPKVTIDTSPPHVTINDRFASEQRRNIVKEVVGDRPKSELEALGLQPKPGAEQLSGCTPKMFVQDVESGDTFLFKPTSEGSAKHAVDVAVTGIRAQAGEPVVPMFDTTVSTPEGALQGYAKPMLPTCGALSTHPTTWSEAQKATVLADAPWFEFLGNYDSKVSQYVALEAPGGEVHALNVDWDLSLKEYAKPDGKLDRHKNGDYMFPPASTLLFHDYVRGKVDCDFAPMLEAVERIERLDEATLRAELAPVLGLDFSKGTFGEISSGEELVQEMLRRQKTLRGSVETLISELKQERLEKAGVVDVASRREWLDRKGDDLQLKAGARLERSRVRGYMEVVARIFNRRSEP